MCCVCVVAVHTHTHTDGNSQSTLSYNLAGCPCGSAPPTPSRYIEMSCECGKWYHFPITHYVCDREGDRSQPTSAKYSVSLSPFTRKIASPHTPFEI